MKINKKNILCVAGFFSIAIFTIQTADLNEKFKLKYEERSIKIAVDKLVLRQLEPVQQFDFSENPKYISSNPLYFSFTVFEKKSLKMVLDEQAGNSKGYDTLYIDLNSNSRIDADETFKMNNVKDANVPNFKGIVTSDPVKTTIYLADGTKFPYTFIFIYSLAGIKLSDGIKCSIVDKVWYSGYISVGGRKIKTAVIFDLLGYINSKNISDYLKSVCVDINGDGIFEPNTDIYSKEQEITIGTNCFTVNANEISNNYQDISVVLNKVEMKFGSLFSPQHDKFDVRLNNGIQRLNLTGENHKCNVPVGDYSIEQYITKKKDNANNLWTMLLAWKLTGNKINIEENKTIDMKNIEPVDVKIDVVKSKLWVAFSLVFNIGNTNLSRLDLLKNDKSIAPPKFSIINEKGEVVYKNQFRYG